MIEFGRSDSENWILDHQNIDLLKLPQEIWVNEICSKLNASSLKDLRLVCRKLRNELVFWEQILPFSQLNQFRYFYGKQKRLLEPPIERIYFTADDELVTIEDIKRLPQNLKVLDISKTIYDSTNELFENLPQHLKKLVLSWNESFSLIRSRIYFLVRRYPHLQIEFSFRTYGSFSPVCWACYRNDCALLDWVLACQHVDLNRGCTLSGATPLHLACYQGNKEVVALLVERGARVNQVNEDGSSGLYVACRQGESEVALFLLRHGADVNLANQSRRTPLMTACFHNHLEIVKILLDHGASLDLKDDFGIFFFELH